MAATTVIHGGRVLDPATGTDGILDVVLQDGRVLEVGTELVSRYPTAERFDATGLLVTAGLVDAHVHVYEACTPLGVDPDTYCLRRGVTTVCDAGSAGASTYPGLEKFIINKVHTRIVGLVNIALEGLAWSGLAGGAPGGELDNIRQISKEATVEAVQAHKSAIGVKVRLTADIADDGKNEKEAYARALAAARESNTFLMTHHAISVVPLEECPGKMIKGDIYTHLFHGWKSTILEAEDEGKTFRVHPAVKAAQERGVYMDIGHGAGAFNWTVAEQAAALDFWPDIISTDLHTASYHGPAYDLPTVMTKMLHVGMPLEAIVRATTATPAKALGLADIVGSLQPGREADVTVLQLADVDVQLEDVHRQRRNVTKRLVPRAVWRAGQPFEIVLPNPWPNKESGNPTTIQDAVVKDLPCC
eukprot:m.28537 g.28537  ORF g.28537 m.28537 type:complete len:417 (+) comp8866_c0_seq1:177-1427(+)